MNFRQWLESTGKYHWTEWHTPLRIACVGWEGNSVDHELFTFVTHWMEQHLEPLPELKSSHIDYINLSSKRDFLEETHTYDVVVLCHIFNPHESLHSYYSTNPAGMFQISKSHTRENWVRRLLSTDATLIFASGNNAPTGRTTEVGGVFLGNIRGHDKEMMPHQTVYYKI